MWYNQDMKYFITSIALITSLVINFGYIHIAAATGLENSIVGINTNQGDDQEDSEDQEDIEEDESDDDSDDIESEVGQVMNQVSQDGQNDLKDQMGQMKTTTEEKKSLRDGKSSETPTVPAPKDPNIVSVIAADDHVEMEYKQPVKLFGFIPVQLLVHSSIDATGRVKVKFPWIASFTNTDKASLTATLENILANLK